MIKIAPRHALLALAVIAASCVIAACGSSSSSSSKSSSSSTASASSSTSGSASARRTALLACLRAHGVNVPARPPGGFRPGAAGAGGAPPRGRFFGGGAGANSKFAAAFRACGGGNFQGRRFGFSRTRITSYVACVRKNGYNLPNPNFSGNGPVFPANIRSNPQFQAASRKCQNLLVPPRGGTSSTATS